MRVRILEGWRRQPTSAGAIPRHAGNNPPDEPAPPGRLPRWLLSERFRDTLVRKAPDASPPTRLRVLCRLPGALTESLRDNLRWGVMASLCTLILTYPACVLWLGSWYDGWNNSFAKGYENALVGLQAGLFAHLLFVGAMLYVPMAWAHLAASGQFRAFFQFRLIARLVWSKGWAVAGFAAVFSLATIPVMVLRSAPFAFVLANPDAWARAEPAEVLRVIQRYQLAAGIYLFPTYVLLHLLTARLYRAALVKTLTEHPELSGSLPDSLRTLLSESRPTPGAHPRHPVLQKVRWGAQSTSNLFGVLAAAILWFTVIAQIYVGQFLNYIPWAGWLNQPLIHIPCLQVIPKTLG
ncbi:DUF4013 domain-containing protein [Tautonia sp. JC769]|uniref:DUF4013 domain-containing protein n=1 Tax=Tautonia sp. JC769 TaxID=3232135 RepID=UPI00345A4A9F